jgi:hypothetical protein
MVVQDLGCAGGFCIMRPVTPVRTRYVPLGDLCGGHLYDEATSVGVAVAITSGFFLWLLSQTSIGNCNSQELF